MNALLTTFLRTILAYLLILVVTRFMGRKAISQITFFDLAVVITLGSVTGNLAMGQNRSVISVALVIFTFGALDILTSFLQIKSIKIRKYTNSEPVTAIENGRILDKNLKKVHFTMNELTSLLREKNIFNYADVEFAIIENDGQLSVLPKAQKAPLTPSDLKIPTKSMGLTKDIVIDGQILGENLKSVNLDENWLKSQLTSQGVSDVKKVFYAGVDADKNLYVSIKQTNEKEVHGQHGFE